MTEGTNIGTVGTRTSIDGLLMNYFPERPDTLLYDVFESEQSALLAALLMEQRGEDYTTQEDEATTATYHAEEYTVSESGPKEADSNDEIDGKRISFGSTVTEVDLRFTDEIQVAFKEPANPNRVIRYRKSDSPIAGIPVETQAMWVSRGPNATSDPTVFVEGYRNE